MNNGFTVEITERHIALETTGNGRYVCPVATALHEYLGLDRCRRVRVEEVRAGEQSVTLTDGRVFGFDLETARFIVDFDMRLDYVERSMRGRDPRCIFHESFRPFSATFFSGN